MKSTLVAVYQPNALQMSLMFDMIAMGFPQPVVLLALGIQPVATIALIVDEPKPEEIPADFMPVEVQPDGLGQDWLSSLLGDDDGVFADYGPATEDCPHGIPTTSDCTECQAEVQTQAVLDGIERQIVQQEGVESKF